MKSIHPIVERYLEGKLPLPGFFLQGFLNQYFSLFNRLEGFHDYFNPSMPPESSEIAVRSQELMDTHYNMPLAMFENFLGRTMKYSTALWETGARDLEAAQEVMMDDLCEKAGIQNGDRVLDIGCGFGSFAEHLLRRFPETRVHGLTLSQTQADYLRDRQAERGHPFNSDRFSLIQEDFNTATFDQRFDRVISIGVFEHISNIGKALEKIRTFIAPDGACLLHFITYRPLPGHPQTPRQDRFMDQYIFPGGRVWCDTEMARHQEHFRLEQQWFLNGLNYCKTLQGWLSNFLANQHRIRAETDLSPRKLRLWELYLRACSALFKVRGGKFYGNSQYLLKPT